MKQLTLLDNDNKFLTISKPPIQDNDSEITKHFAIGILRSIPGTNKQLRALILLLIAFLLTPFILDGTKIYSFEIPVRTTSSNFKSGVITSDGQYLVFLAADRGVKDVLMVFNARTGATSHKVLIRQAGVKVRKPGTW